MKTKKVVRKIFDTLNYSKKMKISSILPDRDSDYAILLELDRKSTRLNSSHSGESRMPSSA